MQGAYGGLVVIMIYGTFDSPPIVEIQILTESDLPLLTETSEEILTG